MSYKQYINNYVYLIYIFPIDDYSSTFISHELYPISITKIYLFISFYEKKKFNLSH